MAASKENPIYTVYVVSGGKKYNLSEVVENLKFTDQEAQFSKGVHISLANIQTEGKWLVSLLNVRDRVYIYADDGERNEEVWRGFVWANGYKSSTSSRLIVLKCYDNLIYMQESEESEYFSSGKETKAVMQSICEKWGVKLEYTYDSITHDKLPLRGPLSDIITADILDLVKDRTGKKYVILSEKDVMQVKEVGKNDTIYKIISKGNAITTEAEITLDGVATKVVILGKADDNDRRPVEATVTGETAKYGTLQKIINRDENTSLADSKKEAQSLIDEKKPKWEYRLEAPDIPWIRKGDKVYVSAGSLIGYFIVKGIERSIENAKKVMSLTMEDMSSSGSSSGSSEGGKATTEAIAREVIAGKWGNGADRKKRLEEAGYNYSEVQALVNKLLRG